MAARSPRLIAAALALLCGCACDAAQNRPQPSSRGASAAAPAASRDYRWLIDPGLPAPTVAAENGRPGTTAWRLAGGPSDQLGGIRSGDVAGYVSQPAVLPGQTERLYVEAPGERYVRITIFRVGWYGGLGGRSVLRSRRLPLPSQPPCTHRARTGLTECRWRPTLSFPIPAALPSGVYIAKLVTRHGQSDALFVVRSPRPAPLLVQLPVATYEAYNAWGGDSLYPGGSDPVAVTGTTQGVAVSLDRPFDSITGAGQFFARDVAMIRFLERYGYPVAYTTDTSVATEPAQLLGPRAVLDVGHSEYWSERQERAFVVARDAGESLLFFSSDTLAWRVRYAPASPASSEPGAPAHVIIAYKEHAALDPDRGEPSGAFPGGGAALTGSAYLGCITPRINQPGPPVYRYYAWSPASLEPPWLFAGTGITPATRIPGIVGYELDQRTSASPPGTQLVGGGAAPCMPAAPEEPHPGPGEDLAQTTLRTARSGALVFASGTLGWELGLEPVPSASPDVPTAPDPRLVAMTRNLLGRVLAHRPHRG